MAPIKRGWYTFFLDRAIGWWSGLPWESSSFTVERKRIPVGDDIRLAANLYLTTLAKPHGTILIRTSYGIEGIAALPARLFAARGYHVLHAACRGTDPSDGCELLPGVHEKADGQATVAWMRQEPWYTGSFGMLGASYLGYTQWAILCNPPDDMKAAVICTAMTDLRWTIRSRDGAPDAHAIAWTDLMTAAKRGLDPGPSLVQGQSKRLKPVYDQVPLIKGVEDHFGSHLPDWLRYCITDPDLESPFFKQMDFTEALDHAAIPILQTTGWEDFLVDTIVDQHRVLAGKGRPAYLTIGPWSHIASGRQSVAEQFSFIEEHLGNRPPKIPREAPVRAYITGANEWRNYAAWPPVPSSTYELYLGPGETLTSEQPHGTQGESRFKFDPRQPTPAISLIRPFDGIHAASSNDSAFTSRGDVAVFTSPLLESDLEVIGLPSIELHHSTDNPYADLLVRLSEVTSNGKSHRISEMYKRLDPDRGDGPLKLDLLNCGHRFRKGTRIRVVIAGGAHPAKIRNLGTAGNQGTGTEMKDAVHTVHHSRSRPSKLSLPVV